MLKLTRSSVIQNQINLTSNTCAFKDKRKNRGERDDSGFDRGSYSAAEPAGNSTKSETGLFKLPIEILMRIFEYVEGNHELKGNLNRPWGNEGSHFYDDIATQLIFYMPRTVRNVKSYFPFLFYLLRESILHTLSRHASRLTHLDETCRKMRLLTIPFAAVG